MKLAGFLKFFNFVVWNFELCSKKEKAATDSQIILITDYFVYSPQVIHLNSKTSKLLNF